MLSELQLSDRGSQIVRTAGVQLRFSKSWLALRFSLLVFIQNHELLSDDGRSDSIVLVNCSQTTVSKMRTTVVRPQVRLLLISHDLVGLELHSFSCRSLKSELQSDDCSSLNTRLQGHQGFSRGQNCSQLTAV